MTDPFEASDRPATGDSPIAGGAVNEGNNQSQVIISVSSDDEDSDTSYGADNQSQTTSLVSSIWNYHYENGRRYNSFRQGTYWGPNDEHSADQMDINHHLFLLTLNGSLNLAPITPHPNRILDIGTGTGIWAIDMGDRYPSASIIGNDLSPIQPSYVPPNVQFEIDDFCDNWTYTPSTFDFIHARRIFGCVSSYPALYAEILNALKPGGWYEQVEVDPVPQSEDGSIAGTTFEQWGPIALEAGKQFGKPLRVLNTMKQDMVEAGFEEVREVRYKWPIGGWPKDRRMKEIGRYNGVAWDQGIEGWVMYLYTNYLKWSKEEVLILCAKLREAMRDRRVHPYQDIAFCYGRKSHARPELEDLAPAPATTASAPTPTAGAPSAEETGRY